MLVPRSLALSGLELRLRVQGLGFRVSLVELLGCPFKTLQTTSQIRSSFAQEGELFECPKGPHFGFMASGLGALHPRFRTQ